MCSIKRDSSPGVLAGIGSVACGTLIAFQLATHVASAANQTEKKILLEGIAEIAKHEYFADIHAISQSLGIALKEDTPSSYAGRARRFVPVVDESSQVKEIRLVKRSDTDSTVRIFPKAEVCVDLDGIEQTFKVKPEPFSVPIDAHHRTPSGGLSITTSFVHGGFTAFVLGDSKKVVGVNAYMAKEGGCAYELSVGYSYGPGAKRFGLEYREVK